MTEPVTQDREGRIKRARRRVDGARHEITERATDLEARVPAARSAVLAYEHDRAVGGEIMAGAIAFRSFVFMLPLVLVLVLTLGIAADSTDGGASTISKDLGISGIAAQSVSQSARVSGGGRWIALFLGLIALYSTSIALARALRIAHALAWGKQVAPMKRTWRAALVVVGATLIAFGLMAIVSRLNTTSHLAALIVALLAVLAYMGLWFGVSRLLPHSDAPWTALIPGSILVGFGVLVLHVVSVFYISRRISHSSSLYGTLGGAIAILAWAYLVGRLLVSSAVLNASLYREREQT
jgi:membrane protein